MSFKDRFKEYVNNYFTPESGEVRIRDYVRELPEAVTQNFAEQIGQPFFRGTAAAASGIHSIGLGAMAAVDPSKTWQQYQEEMGFSVTPSTPFQKGLYGTDKSVTPGSYGREVRAGIGGDKDLPIDPTLGFVVGFSEAIPGSKPAKEGAKVALDVSSRVISKYGDTIGKKIVEGGRELMEMSMVRGKEEVIYNKLNIDKVQAVSTKLSDKFQEFGRAYRETKKIRGEDRAQRVAEAQKALESIEDPTEAFKTAKSSLAGEYGKAKLPKIELNEEEANLLFKQIQTSPDLLTFEKVNARDGLLKMLGDEIMEGKVPTPSELKHLKTVFGESMVNSYYDSLMKEGGSIAETIAQIANVPRALMSSADMSAPLRQGLLLTVDQPKNAAKAFASMTRYFFDDRYFQASMEAIEKSPLAKYRRAAGLELTDVSGTNFSLGTKEEAYMTDLAQKIPAIGSLVKASERAYSGFLNKLRADVFDDVAKEMMAGGLDIELDQKEFEGVARFINVATGRGEIGYALPFSASKDFGKALDRSAPLLNSVFFSPRFLASRLQMFNPRWYMSLSRPAQKMAARSVVKLASTGVGLLSLAAMNKDMEVETDPRSSDFGKIKYGDFRYDLWGGFQQPMVFATRLITGETKSASSGTVRELNQPGPYNSTYADVTERFFRSKLAPVPASVVDFMKGETVVGEEVTVPQQLQAKLLPFLAQDIIEASKEEGLARSTALLSPSFFGVGAQYFPMDVKGGRSEGARRSEGRGDSKGRAE